jgi:hypothetical protein
MMNGVKIGGGRIWGTKGRAHTHALTERRAPRRSWICETVPQQQQPTAAMAAASTHIRLGPARTRACAGEKHAVGDGTCACGARV